MSRLLLAILSVVAGCGTVDLPNEFSPLKRIVAGNPMGRRSVFTAGSSMVVSDLGRYEDLGDPVIRAVILHEQEHSKRQGRWWPMWVARYFSSRDFAWAEEQRGWYVQLLELRRQGLTVNAPEVAKILSDYWHPAGELVSYVDALAWVEDVLSGRWSPQ